METRPVRDVDAAIAEARGFPSEAAWRDFRDASPERQAELIREFRNRKHGNSSLRHDLDILRETR